MLDVRSRGPAEWTDERIAAMKRMWEEGKSAPQIARALGGVSRSSVLGKLHRLKTAKRVTPGARVPTKKKVKGERPPRPMAKVPPMDSAPIGLPAEFLDIGVDVTHLVGSVKITELDHHSCKFPLGDPQSPDFAFCGKERVPGRPYCLDHCHRAYVGFRP